MNKNSSKVFLDKSISAWLLWMTPKYHIWILAQLVLLLYMKFISSQKEIEGYKKEVKLPHIYHL